jgi:hypothetical protein
LGGVILLVALFYTEEDWRGKRAWENCKRDLKAKGEVLDWNAYIPPPVPDDQNFFKASKMQEWFVGRETTELSRRLANPKTALFDAASQITNEVQARDYLAWSGQFEPDFDLIRNALKRSYARMDGDYRQSLAMPVPNFVTVRIVVQTLAQRAHCYLLLGQPEKALHELTLLNDSRRLLEGAPTGKPMTLIAAMINVAVTGLYVDIIADGMRCNAWNEPQLAAIQKQLEQISLSHFLVEAIHEERAGICHIIENDMLAKVKDVRRPNFMRVWLCQNMVNIVRLDQEVIGIVDLNNDLILPKKANNVQRELAAIGRYSFFKPYTFFVAIAVPNFTRAFQTLAHNQTLVNEAQIACALERYRLAHGEYPDTIAALLPQFIEKLPHDIIDGQPLHYRRTGDGKFMLYSVGWNEIDDGGQIAFKKDGSEDWEKGDWVWRYPQK